MNSDLRNIPLFADFTDKELEAIRAIARKATIAKGEYTKSVTTPVDRIQESEFRMARE